MPDHEHELPSTQKEMGSTSTTGGARYPVGPSTGRSNGKASAPGVAEALGHQGVPEEKQPVVAEPRLPRAADEAALRRVARRRARKETQRKERVDVRYSTDEKTDILAMARSLNIAAAHYVGAVVMAHVHGDLALPGQRAPVDDLIDELNALRTQVAKIGTNINQIARVLNSGGHPHPQDTAVLAQAERTLNAVAATVTAIDVTSDHTASTKQAG
ncbi:MobC family plasmid mobilization relaxosome protein [Streptomyces sp. NPDC091212]|uniref:MobC family plasmid mobilization relaxosome protein n=1 Tax=Streptomyces sp. NPDC091212 TaxID=3155191 RepID=UPI0034203C25